MTSRIALGSIAVGTLVLVLKLIAWRMTGSIALYSDALESTVNVVTALAAYIAIRVAMRPADKTHPYGHSKAEYFSAVLEGVLIVVAALLILISNLLFLRIISILPACGCLMFRLHLTVFIRLMLHFLHLFLVGWVLSSHGCCCCCCCCCCHCCLRNCCLL